MISEDRGVLRMWDSKSLRRFGVMSLVVTALLVGLTGPVFAQSTGGITGTTTDPKGAAMAGVTVLVHNADTGIDQKAVTTNDSGIYVVPLLPPGNYDITASQTGFASVLHKGVQVAVGTTVRIDIEMPVATQQSLLTVTTEAPLVETEKTEQTQNVTESLVADLPVSSRNWQQFVLLTPGLTSEHRSLTGAISFHGLNSLYNNNTVDGANNYSAYNGIDRGNGGGAVLTAADGYVYSPDSVREFQVASSNYSAELGLAAGGSVNAVTKSGTNSIHGDLFENLRNPIFNALDPVTKASAAVNGTVATQPVHQQNQFGGSVGGPLLKDKFFYFITYDGYRKVDPITYTTSQANPPISSLPCPATAFVSAIQCTSARNWLSTDELGSFPRELYQDIGLGKIDYQLNPSNHLNATFNWRNWTEPLSTAFASSNNSGAGAGVKNYVQDRFLIANWTSLIGSNKVNEVIFQWGTDNSLIQANTSPPVVSLSNLFGYGSSGIGPRVFADEQRYQIADNFSFTKGTHAFKTGVDLNFINVMSKTSAPSIGDYSYSSAVALPAAAGCSGTADTIFCDWLVDLYGVNVGDNKTGQHWTQFTENKDQRFPGNQLDPQAFVDAFPMNNYSGYFQDTWKARSNLTVNAGLRYDVQIVPPLPEPNDNLPILAYYTTHDPIDFSGIQPRLGVAWNFTKNSVLRFGGGIFYANTPGGTLKAIRKASGLIEQRFICTPTTALCSTLTFPNMLFNQLGVPVAPLFTIPGAPMNQQPPTPTILNPPGDVCAGNPACETRGMDPNAVRPRAYQAEVAYERQLPGNIGFTANYIFTRGVHLPSYENVNLAPPTVTKTYDVVNTSGVTQLQTTVPFFTHAIGPTTGPIEAGGSSINSLYNAMVLTVRRPMNHGLELLANYTLSKATDDGEGSNSAGGGGGQATPGVGVLDIYNAHLDQGYSGTDNRNRFSASVVWQPEFAKNLSGRAARGLLGGWALSGTLQYSSNTRYSAMNQSGSTECSTTGTAPACTAGGLPAVGPSMTGALDTGGGRVFWLPRASFVLPPYTDVDMRLAKEFTIRERFHFEFRAEAFNLFNSAIVLAVNTTAYTYAQPGSSGCIGHTNTCMVPVAGFQTPTTTQSNNLGSRQFQFGARFSF